MSVSDQVRAAIEHRKVTLYRIAKDSGVSWPVLHRFVNCQDIKASSLDKLAEYFGMRLTKAKQPRAKKKR